MIFSGGSKEKNADSGASFCTKLLFFIFLFSFTLTLTLFLVDYKTGQLHQLRSQLPPEVQELIEKAGDVLADFIVKVRKFNTQVLMKVEELSRKVPVGDKTLADYLFAAKILKVQLIKIQYNNFRL